MFEDECSQVKFLTITHVIHLLAETSVILTYMLRRSLGALLLALASRPKWQSLLKREVFGFVRENTIQECPGESLQRIFSCRHPFRAA
ncbi:unnamed protein product [Protopolystoma xenopodis]|uniref:Uncharacterized protein n=1 Tax=Protopolystoma xenopodis TaxID=117903 RepID=A0A3S5BXT0_9PLAT|nr:unnamed protein product [Protopolystoma xenopodis]